MTREEAKDILFLDEDGFFVQDALVDKIFDDFESRTCSNCIYFDKAPTEYHENECLNKFNDEIVNFGMDTTFGCNKWEAK